MKRNKRNCTICDLQISLSNYPRHINSCSGPRADTVHIDSEWELNNGMYECPYCKKEYTKNGILTHIWRNHGDGINHNPNIGYITKNRKIWNLGLDKENSESVRNGAKLYSEKIKDGSIKPLFLGKTHSSEAKKIMSKKRSINNKGGRSKWYDVEKPNGKIIQVQGTWEARFAKVLNLIDPLWIKPGSRFKGHSFKWKDDKLIEHTYTPDFWSPKFKKYFEVKGYWWGNDKEKIKKVLEQNVINLEIIEKKELEIYEKLY